MTNHTGVYTLFRNDTYQLKGIRDSFFATGISLCSCRYSFVIEVLVLDAEQLHVFIHERNNTHHELAVNCIVDIITISNWYFINY